MLLARRLAIAVMCVAVAVMARAQESPLAPAPIVDSGAYPEPVFEVAAVGEAMFYSVPDALGLASLRAHADEIGVLAPQCFALQRDGTLRGSLPADVLTTAQDDHIPLMPLVINASFSRTNAERLLRNPSARDRAVGALVETARELGLDGWQIDFEGLPSSQRAAFSRFVAEVAAALHRHGKRLSVAVAARTQDDPSSDNYRSFSGVYDYASLAASADFLSVMAYPESDASHPGPLAAEPWVEQVVEHVLQSAPPDKISLGLPTYQTDWMQRRIRVSVRERVGKHIRRVFHTVYRLFHHDGPVIHNADTPLEWDPVLESSYRVEGEGRHRKVTWVEDERSFAAKLELVDKYHLHGFSVWRIGLEDPHIWAELPPAPRAAAAAATAAAPPRLIPAGDGSGLL